MKHLLYIFVAAFLSVSQYLSASTPYTEFEIVADTAVVEQSPLDQFVIESFKTIPDSIIQVLNTSARLDMVDYYEYGMDFPSKNLIDGSSKITSIADGVLSVSLTGVTDAKLIALPSSADTLTLMITNYRIPAVDSRLAVYSTDWADLSESTLPTVDLKKLLTSEGRKQANELGGHVKFLVLQADYDPATAVLTLTNNSLQPLSQEEQKKYAPLMVEKLRYRWNGRKFIETK